jgi:hypothetical protein
LAAGILCGPFFSQRVLTELELTARQAAASVEKPLGFVTGRFQHVDFEFVGEGGSGVVLYWVPAEAEENVAAGHLVGCEETGKGIWGFWGRRILLANGFFFCGEGSSWFDGFEVLGFHLSQRVGIFEEENVNCVYILVW